jgi:hypothetical protein
MLSLPNTFINLKYLYCNGCDIEYLPTTFLNLKVLNTSYTMIEYIPSQFYLLETHIDNFLDTKEILKKNHLN